MKKFIYLRRFILIPLLLVFCTTIKGQMTALSGIWEGDLSIGEERLKLVLFVEDRGDSLYVVLDSPDQYVTDIKTDSYSFRNDTVRFTVKALECKYVGRYDGEKIVGKFTQRGASFKLTLKKTEVRQLFPRPQEPMPPYPYDEIKLSIPYTTNGQKVNGTLTLPREGKPKAAVIFISGSGWQDRDESIFGHKPFKLLADQLTRAGYATFRYDDPPRATFVKQTTFDFVQIVQAIFDSLSTRKNLHNAPVGLLGHSEGGLVSWIAAAENPGIAFVVSLAGPSQQLDKILLYQVKKTYQSAESNHGKTDRILQVSNDLYNIIKKSKTIERARKKVDQYYEKLLRAGNGQTDSTVKEMVSAEKEQLLQPWFFTLMHIDPTVYIKKVKCPVLALNGSQDAQVESNANLAGIQDNLTQNPVSECIELKGMNHLLQECDTGLWDEYGKIEQTLSPKAIQLILNWLDKTVK